MKLAPDLMPKNKRDRIDDLVAEFERTFPREILGVPGPQVLDALERKCARLRVEVLKIFDGDEFAVDELQNPD